LHCKSNVNYVLNKFILMLNNKFLSSD
jgi:hypothetical protein